MPIQIKLFFLRKIRQEADLNYSFGSKSDENNNSSIIKDSFISLGFQFEDNGTYFTNEDITIDEIAINDGEYIKINSGGKIIIKSDFKVDKGGKLYINVDALSSNQVSSEELSFEEKGQNIVQQRYETKLYNNYPNPFNPVTEIQYSLECECDIKIVIYNVKGQIVNKIVDGIQAQGIHTVIWDSKDDTGKLVSSGVYFYRFVVNGENKSLKKMLLIK